MAWADKTAAFRRSFALLAAAVLILIPGGGGLSAQEGSLSGEFERNQGILEKASEFELRGNALHRGRVFQKRRVGLSKFGGRRPFELEGDAEVL
ncbi:MAG: hypothetical protein LBL43_04895, partial [Treponema sp.]|nr:hypothetical protein [Treponema sp.]